MNNLGRKTIAVVPLLLAIFFLPSCSNAPVDDGKISITTKSDKARELFVEARDLNEKLRFTDALPLLRQAVELDPTFAQGHWLLAQVQPTAAGFFASLEQARLNAASATEGERWQIQATDAGVNGELVVQEEILNRLVAAFPRDERAHTQIGNFLFGQQRWPEAITAYEKAIALDSSYSPPYNQIGYAYRFTDRFAEAESAFRKYTQLIPNDPNPYDSYAELLLKMGRYEESIAQYEKALAQQKTFGASYVGIATNLDLLGRHDEARSRLQQFYDLALNDGQRRTALGGMAVSYIDEGNFDGALAQVQKQYDIAAAVGDYSNMSGDVNFMGNILLQMGRFDEAQQRFEETIALQEKAQNTSEEVKELARLNFHFDAGRVAAWRGDLATAKEHLTKYQTQAEANKNQFQIWAAHQLAGIVALQEKNWDEAISQINQSNSQNPFNSYLLGVAYQGKGDSGRSTEYLQKAANFNVVGNAQLAFARQRILAMQGKA